MVEEEEKRIIGRDATLDSESEQRRGGAGREINETTNWDQIRTFLLTSVIGKHTKMVLRLQGNFRRCRSVQIQKMDAKSVFWQVAVDPDGRGKEKSRTSWERIYFST